MTTQYVWKIDQLERDAATGIATVAHWRCNGTDGATPPHTGTVYSSIKLGPAPANPVPYANLTEADAVAWVQELLGAAGVAAVEAAIDQQIAQQVAPATLTGVPWATSSSSATSGTTTSGTV